MRKLLLLITLLYTTACVFAQTGDQKDYFWANQQFKALVMQAGSTNDSIVVRDPNGILKALPWYDFSAKTVDSVYRTSDSTVLFLYVNGQNFTIEIPNIAYNDSRYALTGSTVVAMRDTSEAGIITTWVNRSSTPAPVITLTNISPTTIATNSLNLLRQYSATPPPVHGNELLDSIGLGWRDSTGRTVFLTKGLVPAGSTIIDSFQNKSGKITLLKDTQNLVYPYTSNPAGYLTSATVNAWLPGGNTSPSLYTIGAKNNRGFGVITNNQQAIYIDSLQNIEILSPNNLGTNHDFTFSQRSFTGGAYPVPYFQPVTSGTNINFDLIPKGATGQSIMDICNSSTADIIANPLAGLNTLRLGCSANGGFGSIVQSTTYGAQPAQPLLISVEAANNSTTLRNQLFMDTTGFTAFCPGCSIAGTHPDNYFTVVSAATAKGIEIVPNGSVAPAYSFASAFGTPVAYIGYVASGAGSYLSPTQVGDVGLCNASNQAGNLFIGNRNHKSIWMSTSRVVGADSIRFSINPAGNVTVSSVVDTAYYSCYALNVESGLNRGIGLPKFTTAQYVNINLPLENLLTYNTTTHKPTIYDGTVENPILDSTSILAGTNIIITPTAGGVLTLSTNLSPTLTKLNITTGSNATVGTATLSGGTITVSTTAVTASSKIFLTDATTGALTNVGTPTVGTVIAGASFIINSSNVLDASNINWFIIN